MSLASTLVMWVNSRALSCERLAEPVERRLALLLVLVRQQVQRRLRAAAPRRRPRTSAPPSSRRTAGSRPARRSPTSRGTAPRPAPRAGRAWPCAARRTTAGSAPAPRRAANAASSTASSMRLSSSSKKISPVERSVSAWLRSPRNFARVRVLRVLRVVEIGERAEPPGDVAELLDRADRLDQPARLRQRLELALVVGLERLGLRLAPTRGRASAPATRARIEVVEIPFRQRRRTLVTLLRRRRRWLVMDRSGSARFESARTITAPARSVPSRAGRRSCAYE